MQIRKLHMEEPDIDVALVRRLLSSQMPQWANLPLRLVESIGTDNVMIRVGDSLVIRMPRTQVRQRESQRSNSWCRIWLHTYRSPCPFR